MRGCASATRCASTSEASRGGGALPAPPAGRGAAPSRSIRDAFAAGDAAGARAIAEEDLRAAIGSATLQRQGFAVDALALARAP
ncbi:MAG TPA: hypothetical protein VGD80_19955, partial [Kofleriaceae bacterium]